MSLTMVLLIMPGIETGDVIVEFDGIKIQSVDHLRNNVSFLKARQIL